MKVVNLRKEKYTRYIGRGSVFGNPFKIDKDGTREEVIKKYEIYIRQYLYQSKPIHYSGKIHKVNFLTSLGRNIYDLAENTILGCYCKPKPCHGDVIIKIWKELHNEKL